MGKIKRREQEIRALSADELSELRRWFIEYDAEAWDREIEADVKSGKLDRLAEEALRDHAEGRRDAGMEKVTSDPGMQFEGVPPPFDGRRLIAAGFTPMPLGADVT